MLDLFNQNIKTKWLVKNMIKTFEPFPFGGCLFLYFQPAITTDTYTRELSTPRGSANWNDTHWRNL